MRGGICVAFWYVVVLLLMRVSGDKIPIYMLESLELSKVYDVGIQPIQAKIGVYLMHLQRKANYLMMLVAANPETPPAVIEQLAAEQDTELLEHVAENPSSPAHVLKNLSAHIQCSIRQGVAQNRNTPEETMWMLTFDENPDVRYSLAANPHVAVTILEKLGQDENPYVACRAGQTLSRLKAAVQQVRALTFRVAEAS